MIWTQKKDNNKTFTYIWLYSSHLLLSYYSLYRIFSSFYSIFSSLYSIFSCWYKGQSSEGSPCNSLLRNTHRWRSTRGILCPHLTYIPIFHFKGSMKNFPGVTANWSPGTAPAECTRSVPSERASLLPTPSMAILWAQTKSRPAAPRKGPERGARRCRAVRRTNSSTVCRDLASILTLTEW